MRFPHEEMKFHIHFAHRKSLLETIDYHFRSLPVGERVNR